MELRKVRLGEIAEVDISSVDKKCKEEESPVRLCNFVDVYYNWAVTADMECNFMEATANTNEIDRFKLKRGQVALTKDSETRYDIGIATYIADTFANSILGYHNALITPCADKLNGKYLNALLHTDYARKYFANNATGSGQRYALSIDALNDFGVPQVSLREQERVGEIFSLIDRKIALNRQMNATLEAMARQLYDYWFLQFDFPDAHGKPYKSSGGKMTWNNKLKRDIPEGWSCGTLLDIAEYTNGLACQKFRPTGADRLPVIKIKEMHEGLSADTEWVKSDIPEAVKVYDGDVLFSWSASLEVMLWAYGKGGLNQHIFKVTSKNGYPRSFYYYQLLNYIGVFKRMAEARKTTMGHITQDHLKQSTIALPPSVDIANRLEGKLFPIFDSIVKNNQEIMHLTRLRTTLLPLLMNGQVEVTKAL